MSYDDHINRAFQDAEAETETLGQARVDIQAELEDSGMGSAQAEMQAVDMSNNAVRLWLMNKGENNG